MAPLIGVLSPNRDRLIWMDNGTRFHDLYPSEDVRDIMRELGIRQAWTSPGTPAEAPWWTTGEEYHVVNTAASAEAGAWHCWNDAGGAHELAAGLAQFVDCIGMLPIAGPASTGDILIRRTNPAELDAWRTLPRPDYKQGDLMWIRQEWPTSPYLHAYDCRNQYLSVLGGLRLGIGARWYLSQYEVERAFKAPHELPCGYWRLNHWPREPEPEIWPAVVDTPRKAAGPVWVASPTLELLLGDDEPWPLVCDLAIVNAGYSRALEPFYKRLRAAVKAGGLAGAAAKETYTRTIGRFASNQWDRRGDALYRPDWRDAIVAQARANLHRMIAHVHSRRGLLPAAVYVDELFYESDSPEPDYCDGSIPAERYKHSGTIEVASSKAWRPPLKSGRRRKPLVAELVRELRP